MTNLTDKIDKRHDHGSSSPKRKRNASQASTLSSSPIQLNTVLGENIAAEEEFRAESPRTKVAHHFENLQLNNSGLSRLDFNRSTHFDLGAESDSDSEALPKRTKLATLPTEIPETPENAGSESAFSGQTELLQGKLDPIIFQGATKTSDIFASDLVRAYPSINRLKDSKSRHSKKSRKSLLSAGGSHGTGGSMEIDRASLTWHDDEITGHDPDDPDDDGEGINGIGFKPTPAMARMRAEKRKQQLADYRSREAREARAKRSERRRGSPIAPATLRDTIESSRKVRFIEETAPETQASITV